MNTPIHRKQIVILTLAMGLAAASYWIPLPRQSSNSPLPARMLGSVDQVASEGAVAYARESATIWRFPVTIQAPQTPVQAIAKQSVEKMPSIAPSPDKKWLSQQDLSNGERLPNQNSLLVPVRGLEQPGR